MTNITFGSSSVPAYVSTPDGGKHAGIVLIHEVWGLTDHIKNIADRFAKEGYNVVAPDLISHTGITAKMDQTIMKDLHDPEKRAEAQKKMREAMAPIQSPEYGKETVEKLKECVTYLLGLPTTTEKIAVVGFCFGGSYGYALATEDTRLSAAVPFYGHPPHPMEKIQNISCPILAFYGEKDENLMKDLDEVAGTMDRYEKDFNYKIYHNTGHAFFNDTNAVTYNKDAAEDAWATTLPFLETKLL